MKKSPAILFLVALALLLTAMLTQKRMPRSAEKIAALAEAELRKEETGVLKKLDWISSFTKDSAIKEAVFYSAENKEEVPEGSAIYYAFYKDSLFAWSDNTVLFSQQEVDGLNSGSLTRLRNGWYQVFKKAKGDYHFYAALLIKNEFAYQNKFLLNHFNPQFKVPSTYNLSVTAVTGALPVRESSGSVLFYIIPGDASAMSSHFTAAAWLYMLAIVFFIIALGAYGKWLIQRSFYGVVLLLLGAIGLRLLSIFLHLPGELYKTELFSPRLYASFTYLNSLGDFLINVLMVLAIVLIFLKPLKGLSSANRSSRIIYFLLLVAVIGATVLLNSLMQGIVFNSSISLNTVNVFELNIYSFIGLAIIALMVFIYFILLRALVYVQHKYNYGKRMSMLIGVLVLVSFIAHAAFIGEAALLALLYISIAYYTRRKNKGGLPVSAIVTFLFIASVYAASSIYVYGKVKEKENRKLLAGKIEDEQDRIAEHLFDDLQHKIAVDTMLQNYLRDTSDVSAVINQRLHRRYFNGYWTKYEIEAYIFDTLHQSFNIALDSGDYERFETVIKTAGRPTYAQDLYFLTNAKGKSMYLGRIPLLKNDSTVAGTIFLEMVPKLIQATKGFPELFISDKVVFNKELSNYSYGKYKDGELVNQYGDYAFYFSPSVFPTPKEEFTFFDKDGYSHLIYRQSPDNLIIISRKDDTAYALITSFSYFFAFFSLLLLLFLGARHIIERGTMLTLSLKSRIQLSVIAIVIFSATMIGAGTIYYIIKKYDDNQSVRITEQLKTLVTTLENSLQDRLNPDTVITEEVIIRLSRLSNTASTDFNWYDNEGDLLFSSQPKIFDQGITSTLMNPTAFDELTDKKKTQFVHPENIGKLHYVAAYQTLHNRQNESLGFISLPYFEKENELKRDVSTFLSALINIYVLLISIAVLLTFFIAARITKPLLLIQEKLAAINLGKKNEFIQWNNKDEIGELVNEYNKKVEELAISADLLAKSERESAWQEMAKQVAHEIKNPLTPMKLGVQHLLHAYNNDSPGKEEMVKKISHTLIQQIDTLTNIANEFSNFAKMPKTKNEVVNIVSVLVDTINLFKESPGVVLSFEKDIYEDKEPNVFADKDQLIRVFSNLLKNAIQSIPSEKNGIVDVKLLQKEGFFTVSVRDNGSGIADNQAEKIFTPNFTTKSGGMGLGLAMVKNIVENSGGKVWFETQIGAGTTFFVSLPALP